MTIVLPSVVKNQLTILVVLWKHLTDLVIVCPYNFKRIVIKVSSIITTAPIFCVARTYWFLDIGKVTNIVSLINTSVSAVHKGFFNCITIRRTGQFRAHITIFTMSSMQKSIVFYEKLKNSIDNQIHRQIKFRLCNLNIFPTFCRCNRCNLLQTCSKE